MKLPETPHVAAAWAFSSCSEMARSRPPSLLFLLPLGSCRHALGKLGSVGRSGFLRDDFRLVVPEVSSALEAPALESTRPWRWWELPPTSCNLEERADVRGVSLSRKSSPVRESVAGREIGTCSGSEIGRGSGGWVTDLVRPI